LVSWIPLNWWFLASNIDSWLAFWWSSITLDYRWLASNITHVFVNISVLVNDILTIIINIAFIFISIIIWDIDLVLKLVWGNSMKNIYFLDNFWFLDPIGFILLYMLIHTSSNGPKWFKINDLSLWSLLTNFRLIFKNMVKVNNNIIVLADHSFQDIINTIINFNSSINKTLYLQIWLLF
jgi:hypothetical protein